MVNCYVLNKYTIDNSYIWYISRKFVHNKKSVAFIQKNYNFREFPKAKDVLLEMEIKM